MKQELPRSIGLWGGTAITVGVMIGSGIFRTPCAIARELDSPALILLLWAAGGGLCLCGALTYAELATMFPRSGGIYVFLHEGLGPCAAFVFGWTYMLITQPLAVAGIATVFAEHLNHCLSIHFDTRPITCLVIVGLTVLNTAGMRVGASVAVVITGLKVLALAAIVCLAVALVRGPTADHVAGPSAALAGGALAPVMAAILWTYDGWSDVSAVAEEVKEPQRRIPRIFLIGVVGTTALYVAVNAVYHWLVPLSTMRTRNVVAPLVMEQLLGGAGDAVVTAIIMVSTLGAAHGSIIVGSRVTFAQARDRLLFAFPGRVHPVYRTPATALRLQAVLACTAALVLEHFERLMGGFVFTIWIFYGASALAIFVLRRRRPDHDRPYRCLGYPVIPGIFVLAAAGMTFLGVHDSPRDTLPWLAVLVAGIPAYLLWRRVTSRLATDNMSIQ